MTKLFLRVVQLAITWVYAMAQKAKKPEKEPVIFYNELVRGSQRIKRKGNVAFHGSGLQIHGPHEADV